MNDLKRYDVFKTTQSYFIDGCPMYKCSDFDEYIAKHLPKWISVDNKPIPTNEDLLFGHYNATDGLWIWIASGTLEAGEYWLDWKDDTFDPVYMHSITHWMPLPEAPTEGK